MILEKVSSEIPQKCPLLSKSLRPVIEIKTATNKGRKIIFYSCRSAIHGNSTCEECPVRYGGYPFENSPPEN